MAGQRKRKRKYSIWEFVRLLVMAAALIVLLYSAYQLYSIYHVYQAAGEEYEKLANEFTSPVQETAPSGTAESKSEKTGTGSTASGEMPADESSELPGEEPEEEPRLIEDAAPPLAVDWNALKAVNSDIIGWIYVDAQPSISYPICQSGNNDYYLHRTFRREELFAGAIFADCVNSPDFSDSNTIVYGHNMKNGSMFGMLKFIRQQETYDSAPFFWILTPEGNYRYHIYAAMSTPVDSEAYKLFEDRGEEFVSWEQRMQAASDVKNDVTFSKNDFTVTLSTCTSDSSLRCVVMGKLVSTDHP